MWKAINIAKPITEISEMAIPAHNEMIISFIVAGRTDLSQEIYVPLSGNYNSAISVFLPNSEGTMKQFTTAIVRCSATTISCKVVTDSNLAIVTYLEDIYYK